MDFRTSIKNINIPLEINHENKIMMIGSCFTNNIGVKLEEAKFNVFKNPSGIIFNPVSIFNTIGDIINERVYTPNDLENVKGKHFSFNHHTSFSSKNIETCLNGINLNNQKGFEYIKDGDVLFITFGSAWAYKHKETKKFVANCHKLPQKIFEKELLDINKLVSAYTDLFNRLFYLNNKIKVVLTVSPVRHIKDGIINNQLSKSILVYLSHVLESRFENVHYFPSYEIVNDDLRDYRFYESDMIHPNETAISYIWEKFNSTFFSNKTIEISNRFNRLIKGLQHKTENPQSTEYQSFLKKQLAILMLMKDEFPTLNFSEEENFITTQIIN